MRNLGLIALSWILKFPEISCVIPGASKLSQLESNIKASDTIPLNEEEMEGIKMIYENYIKKEVHQKW